MLYNVPEDLLNKKKVCTSYTTDFAFFSCLLVILRKSCYYHSPHVFFLFLLNARCILIQSDMCSKNSSIMRVKKKRNALAKESAKFNFPVSPVLFKQIKKLLLFCILFHRKKNPHCGSFLVFTFIIKFVFFFFLFFAYLILIAEESIMRLFHMRCSQLRKKRE